MISEWSATILRPSISLYRPTPVPGPVPQAGKRFRALVHRLDGEVGGRKSYAGIPSSALFPLLCSTLPSVLFRISEVLAASALETGIPVFADALPFSSSTILTTFQRS